MVDPVMISFHEDSCREYLDYWRDPARREATEMEEDDAAYHVLEHAALLERYVPRGSSQVIRQLEELAADERVHLVRLASQFACQFSLSDYCNRLFGQEVLDVDDMAQVEIVLIQRDALDAVLDFAARLVNERMEEDDDLLAGLARAHCTADELDDTLLSRPDIIAPASRILDETCPPASAGLWLQKAREFDERFQEPTLAEFRRKGIAGKFVAGTGHDPRAETDTRPSCPRCFPVFRDALAAFAARETHYATAAAHHVNTATRAQAALATRIFRVEGDDEVQVKLELDLPPTSSPSGALILVRKGGPPDKTRRYVRCEVMVDGLSSCIVADLGVAAGEVVLTQNALTALREHEGSIGLTLLTEEGTRHTVLLG